MTTNRIWIPSLQKFIRIKEMSCEDRRLLLKSTDDDIDFDLALQFFLESNITEPNFTSENLTVIDRFAIILQSRVYSCGDKLKLNRVCEKCGVKTDFIIDLNNLLDNMSVLDKSFEHIVEDIYAPSSGSITMDFPSAKEYLWADKNSDRMISSCIRSLNYNGKPVAMNLNNMDYDKKHDACSKLPMALWKKAESYVNSLRNVVNKIPITKLVCRNEKCKDELALNMDLDNLLDLTRLLFKDSSLQSVLGQYANLSMNCHFDYNFYKNLSPIELEIIANMLKANENTDSNKTQSDDVDLFQQYRQQTEGMVESSSEFR